MNLMQVSQQHLEMLKTESSQNTREKVALDMSEIYCNDNFSHSEREIAIAIFRLLVSDTAIKVRKALSNRLCRSNNLPKDIVDSLVADEAEVAVNMIEFSNMLEDSDLINIINSTNNIQKIIAITRRKNLSYNLCEILAELRNVPVIQSLLSNLTAQISQDCFKDIFIAYYNDESVLEAMVMRGSLPSYIAEKIYFLISDRLVKQITKKYHLSRYLVNEAAEIEKETAIIKFLSPWMSREEMDILAENMYKNHRLNYSLALRALCIGEYIFFEIIIAKLSSISVKNIHVLLNDSGSLGFRSVCNIAKIPEGFIEATRIIYNIVKNISHINVKMQEDNDISCDNEDYTCNLSNKIASIIIENKYNETIENMSYFLSIMRSK